MSGQEFEQICRELFLSAFAELGQNCEGLANNSACYGFGTVSPDFVALDGSPILKEDTLTLLQAGDQAFLYDTDNNQLLRTVETVVFDPTSEDNSGLTPEITPEADPPADPEAWGIAAIYTSANLPQQLNSIGARILVLGATQITDVTLPENIFIPGTIINVNVDNAEIFTAPPEYPIASTVITNVNGDFEADAITPDGQWVRVFYIYEHRFGSRTTAWLPVDSLAGSPDLSGLPRLGSNYGSPMQHIRLDMSIGQPLCDSDKTGGVLIQGEDAIETDVSINDVPIRLTSALFAELITPECLKITVLDGIVELFPETEQALVLVSGFSIVVGSNCAEDIVPLLENNVVLNGFSGIRATVPDNIIAEIPVVTILTASGNGNPINIIALRDPAEIARISQYCFEETMPDYICIRFSQ